MNAIKPGTKTRLRILFSVLLCAIIIGTTPRVMREFYYRGAFIHYRGILRLVLLIMLPLLLLSYIAFISELKQSQKKLILNVIWWYGVETEQQVLAVGVFDVDDIILNLIGAGFGILAQTAAACFIKKRMRE